MFYTAVKRIFDLGGYKPELLQDDAVKPLLQAIEKSLVKSLSNIETKVPEALLQKLRTDLFVFSGCKSATELREATSFLIEDGKLRTWQSFKEEMTKLHQLYNVNYLQAEYDFAVQTGDIVQRWVQVENDKDRYDLQYRTANDEAVRDSHRVLHDITLPVDDPFWLRYTPPNGWGCRCTFVQVLKNKNTLSDPSDANQRGEKATTEIDKRGRNRLEMFRFNPAKDQVIFPQSHPYYKFRGDLNNE